MALDAPAKRDMNARFSPADVERRWYEFWEESGLFKPNPGSLADTFVITIPPPNVTGELHVGHALTYGLEDVLGRYKRMCGFNTLILPGTDHAGIATQNVVEKELAKEGLSRHDLGREEFLERVWEWKERYATGIRQQFRAMGCGFDWSRERFTMDPGYVDAVLEVFIRLYDEGKIYRGWRVINWCVRCHSAISDIEVDDAEREDSLYYLRYPLRGGDGDIVVATVRPETILGDVAVAVNPDDARYRGLVGKTALLPLLNRELRVIADPMVDMSFGSGAVKITPAHDYNDFEVAERHGLDRPIAIGPDARITSVGGPYEGEDVVTARQSVLRDLEAGGFLVKVEPHVHNVPTCDRCGTVLEPLLSEQWFMRMDELARPAMDVVKHGRVRLVPDRWSHVYLDWMEKIRPWTLSRQLWWGHRIPIYYCADGHATAAKSAPAACSTCGREIVRQDPDVLDTWFSSALWPFAVLGWPEKTRDLEQFYPTSFMNTSSQILYLWIARMIMTGLKFMGDVPFPVVLINPTILNKHGQRMSKSLGTGIDPIDLVRDYGADALRFGLMTSGSTHQQDIRFSTEKVEQARNFANKVWNVARAVITNQAEGEDGELQLQTSDLWILSRASALTAEVSSDLDRLEFSGAGQRIHDFIWSELADWYLEMAKLRLYDDPNAAARFTARAVLWSVLDRSIRLLHPFMPFLTEEIWQHLRTSGSETARRMSGWDGPMPDSIMVAPWPAPTDRQESAERAMALVMEVIRRVRAVRSEYRMDPGKYVSATIVAGTQMRALRGQTNTIGRLARLQPIAVCDVLSEKPANAVTVLVGEITIYLPLDELTDVMAERGRLTKELESARSALADTERKLENESFTIRAPAEVVERERERARTLLERIRRIDDRLEALGYGETEHHE
jgi:valyl-tRNA synthetase